MSISPIPEPNPFNKIKKEEFIGMSSFETPSFQVNFSSNDSSSSSAIESGFSNAVQRFALPYIGKYYSEEYVMTNPLILFKLSSEMLQKTISEELSIEAASENVDSYCMVHSRLPEDTFNIVFHGWVYQGKSAGYRSGLFESMHNTRASSLEGLERNGWQSISIDSFKASIIHAHNLKCSPNNLTLQVSDPSAPLLKFWSAVKKDDRYLITRHIIVNNPEIESNLLEIVEQSETVKDLLEQTQLKTIGVYEEISSFF